MEFWNWPAWAYSLVGIGLIVCIGLIGMIFGPKLNAWSYRRDKHLQAKRQRPRRL
jgi:hypothetical protein